MTLTKLKKNFYSLIDKLEDKELLEHFYLAMTFSAEKKDGELWSSLTERQKKEVMKSYKESLNKKNLLYQERVMKKYSECLTR